MGIQEDLLEFEEELKRLIIEYEKYFLGLEKRQPLTLLAAVERMSRRFLGTPINNTMMKFRYNTLVAKFSTYKQHWNKINLLIEDGKYSRDRYKMKLHSLAPALPREEAQIASQYDAEMVKLHRNYLAARKACKLPEKEIPVESIRQLIEKQKPQILAKHKCRSVEFKVVIEDGTPKIKAVPLA